MAIYPKKSKDPTEVALSAIQDALNVRDADIAPPIAASMATVAEASSDTRKRAPRMPPIEPLEPEPFDPIAFPPSDEREIAQAANDDQEAIGQVLQSMQRPPRSTAFLIATLLSVLWVISALGLMFALGGQLRGLFGDIFTAIPSFIGLATALGAPVVFFYVLANMLKRSQELRAISQSMAETTLRFAEPDTMARDFDRHRRPGDPPRGRGDGRRRRAGARPRGRARDAGQRRGGGAGARLQRQRGAHPQSARRPRPAARDAGRPGRAGA